VVQDPAQRDCVARQAFLLGCGVHGGGGAENVGFEEPVSVELPASYLLGIGVSLHGESVRV